MKITKADYCKLKQLVRPNYEACKQHNIDPRDVNLIRKEALQFVCQHLYKYMNDSHLDTALNKIIGELDNETIAATSV